MSFWWVNHSQTFRQEYDGGYIWSPQKKKNGASNFSYDNLPRTAIGDIVFSFSDGKIKTIGKVIGLCKESKTPESFGKTGQQWDEKGWFVPVEWILLPMPFSPKEHIKQIAPLLPDKYSPIQDNGNGNQGIYLAAIGSELGSLLLTLLEQDEFDLAEVIRDKEEESVMNQIENAPISETEKRQLGLARVGQGKFKANVKRIETKCRITHITEHRFLHASHIKPWSKSTNAERLDGHNGFLLSPHVDKLFDKGWISFANGGQILVSKTLPISILHNWSIDSHKNVGGFTAKQVGYLDYHRTYIFKK